MKAIENLLLSGTGASRGVRRADYDFHQDKAGHQPMTVRTRTNSITTDSIRSDPNAPPWPRKMELENQRCHEIDGAAAREMAKVISIAKTTKARKSSMTMETTTIPMAHVASTQKPCGATRQNCSRAANPRRPGDLIIAFMHYKFGSQNTDAIRHDGPPENGNRGIHHIRVIPVITQLRHCQQRHFMGWEMQNHLGSAPATRY